MAGNRRESRSLPVRILSKQPDHPACLANNFLCVPHGGVGTFPCVYRRGCRFPWGDKRRVFDLYKILRRPWQVPNARNQHSLN
jgi:hypothetical protein